MNEELKKFAERGVLCGVQETNRGEDPLPLYRFPGGVSLE